MYSYIKGQLTVISPAAVTIEAGGVGYHILVANPYRFSEQMNKELTIWLEQVVTQDAIRLYGFYSEEEKLLFQKLNQVSGIGPKSALSILSLGDSAGLIRAIEAEDIKFLRTFPGVGKKTAQQIILDLKGKLADLKTEVEEEKAEPADQTQHEQMLEELSLALETLGYSKRTIDRAIKVSDLDEVTDTAAAIRIALKALTNL